MKRTASSVAGRAGRFTAGSGMLDPLEPRVLLSSFIYQELGEMFISTSPVTVIRPTGDDATATLVSAVAPLGDIDGDGVPDFIVGAGGDEQTDDDGSGIGGSAAVVYSGDTGEELFRFEDGFSEFGGALAGLGDLNDDGVNDFAIGSPRFGSTTLSETDGQGRVYVYSGAEGALLFTVDGPAALDRFGAAVADAGDVNGDGVSDLAVGAPEANGGEGSVFLYSGADASVIRRIDGELPRGRFGFAMASLGDVTGDGLSELVVGAPGQTLPELAAPGQAFIVSGADGAKIMELTGTQPGDLFGYAVASTGDVDGDTVMDVAVGAPLTDVAVGDATVLLDAGMVRVFNGTDAALLHTVSGPSADAHLGAAVELAGDVNQDGAPDLLVGAPGADEEGQVLVISGDDARTLATFGGEGDDLTGADRIGTSVAAIGDIDDDGVSEFLFAGTQSADLNGGNDRNRFYLFQGVPALDLTVTGINDDMDIWGTAETSAFLILDGDFFLLEGRPGLAGSDRIIDVNTSGTVLGVSSGGQSFIWRDGQRTPLMNAFTSTQGPNGVFTTLRGVDINEEGDILVERRRADGVMTAWVIDGDTIRYRFDGVPLAMNDEGWVVGLDHDPVADNSILWTPIGVTTVTDFVAADINEIGDLAGMAFTPEDVPFPALRTPDGAVIDLGSINMGTQFQPIAVNDDRIVIGSYVTDEGADGAWVWDGAMGMQDIKAAAVLGGTEAFAASDNIGLVDVTDTGTIAGATAAFDESFTLTAFDMGGPFTGQQFVDISRDDDGTLLVTTRNEAGEPIAFRMEQGADGWVATDLTETAGVPSALTEVVSYRDPTTGETFAAVGTSNGLLILTRTLNASGAEVWVVRNLTQEIVGAENITSNLLTFTNVDGTVYLAGKTMDGDLVLYHQTGQLQNGQPEWVFLNLYEDRLTPAGEDLPMFEGELHGYVTPWGGLNIAGLDAEGEIIVVWTSPALNGEWQSTNLSEVTGAPTLSGGLTAFVTPWGGINLVGLNADGDVTSTWWVPGFGGNWLTNNLTQEFDGAKLRAESVTSYVTEWGGLNIAGVDENDDVVVYWWVPGFDAWRVTPIVTDFTDAPGRPIGELKGEAIGDTINLTGTARDGDVIRIHWEPDVWRVDNLTDDVQQTETV